MAPANVSQKSRRSALKKVASFFCLGEPQAHAGTYPLNAEPGKPWPKARRPRAGVSTHFEQDQLDLLVEARSRHVVGTPVTLVEPTQLQTLEEDLKKEKEKSENMKGEVQRLTLQLTRGRAHSVELETKVADLESRRTVANMVLTAVQRAALRAELEEEMNMADMVPGIMHRAALREAQELHEELLEAAQIKDLQLIAKTDELAEAKKQIQQQQADSDFLYQACFEKLPTIMEEDCPFVNHLGSGGHGTVDLHTMTVAVKRPHTAADVRRLETELLIMETMNHAQIPKPLATWQPSDGGAKGIIMPYIPGGSLYEQLWRLCTPWCVRHRHECLCILLQLLDVLQYAHSLGRVHANIKTTNLMYQARQLTVTDWALSYLITEPADGWRGTVGTLRAVAAVEPWRRGFEDDVRGFWAAAYELLTGQSVFNLLKKRYNKFHCDPDNEEGLTQLCQDANLNPEIHSNRLLCAEFHQFIGMEEVDFQDLAADDHVPRPFLEMMMHGLSPAVARGDAPTSCLEEIRSVLTASIATLEARMKPPQPPMVPDTVYRGEPKAVAARPPRRKAARRRLDFGGEAEPEAAAAACAHMPPAPEKVDTRKWRDFAAVAAASRADVPREALDIGGQVDPAAAIAAACAQMLAEEGLEATERQKPEPAAAVLRQRLRSVMDFCEEVEPQLAAASLADMLPNTLDTPKREMPASAASSLADMLPETLDTPKREMPAAAAASLADMLPETLDTPKRETPAAAAASLADMLPESLDTPKREMPAAAAASLADMLPETLDTPKREMPAAAAASLADMLPETLDTPKREMPAAAASSLADMLPETLDTPKREMPAAAASSLADMLPETLDTPKREMPAAAAASLADMLPETLDTPKREMPAAAAASLADMLPETLDTPKREMPSAAAASLADMLPETLDTPKREMPAAAAASLADMLPETLDTPKREMPEAAAALPGHTLPLTMEFGDLMQRWVLTAGTDRAEPGDTGEPDAAAGACAHMPAGPLDSGAACGAQVRQHIAATYIQQLPETLDIATGHSSSQLQHYPRSCSLTFWRL